MATEFSYGGEQIVSSGPFKPAGKDMPVDARARVEAYADIASIPNPYIGLRITVKVDETNSNKMTDYIVKSLKANSVGIANTVIDEVVRFVDYLGVSSSGGGTSAGTGEGLTSEQAQQLQTAYEHSQSVHVQASDIPSKTSDLTNDSNYATETFVTSKIAEAQLGGGEADLSAYATKAYADNAVSTALDGHTFKFLTQAEYDDLETKDPLVEYHITDAVDDTIDTSNLASDLSLTGSKLQLKNSSGTLIGTAVTLPSSGTSSYELPKASSSVLGGIKVGANLSIDSNGVLSAISSSSSGTGYDIYNLSGKKIIAYGDSITALGQYLDYAVNKIGVTIKNAGISSTTMTPSSNPGSNGDLLTSFNGTCPDLSKYDIVTIAHGTNDLSSNVPIGEIGLITDTNLNTKTFYGAYRKVIETIINNYPHIRIVLCTPIHKHITTEPNEVVANKAGHKLKDYVDAIHDLANMYSLIVCDMYKDCGINFLNYATYMPDGVHPNDYGGELMGKCYVNSLLKLGFDSQTVVNIPVTGVTISNKNVTVKANNSILITATVEPSDATNKYCVWSSDKPSIATVDNGRIRGMSEGSCTITVTTNDGGFTDTCSVTVEAGEITSQDLTTSVGFETGYITNNGTLNPSAGGSKSTGYLDIEGATTIGVAIDNTTADINAIHFYGSDKKWISTQTPNDSSNKNFIYASVPSNAKYVRATGNSENGMNSFEFYKMTSEGLGNNLIISDTMLDNNAVSPDNGTISSNNGTSASDYISIDENKYYYIEGIASGALYDSNKSYTSGIQYVKVNNKKLFIKSGNNDKYARINALTTNKTNCKFVEAIYIGYITIS